MQLSDLFNNSLETQSEAIISTPLKDMYKIATQNLGTYATKYSLPNPLPQRGNHRLLFIPETHLRDTNIRSRKDYVTEMKDIHACVKHIIKETKPDYTIYMGEIFDRGLKYAQEILYWFTEFLEISNYTTTVATKGNHEDSFYKNNPFWFMAKSSVPNLPINGVGIFKVVPNLILDDVVVTFHHHGVPPNYIKGKRNIGVMHTDIMTKAIRDQISFDKFYVKDIKSPTQKLFPEYDIVFNGHMHGICQMLNIQRTGSDPLLLVYTSSLGRTSSTEVDNDFLNRFLYLIDITGSDISIEPILLTLPCYEDVTDSTAIARNRLVYQNQKQRKSIQQMIKTQDNIDINELFGNDNYLRRLYHLIDTTHPKKFLEQRKTLYRRVFDNEC